MRYHGVSVAKEAEGIITRQGGESFCCIVPKMMWHDMKQELQDRRKTSERAKELIEKMPQQSGKDQTADRVKELTEKVKKMAERQRVEAVKSSGTELFPAEDDLVIRVSRFYEKAMEYFDPDQAFELVKIYMVKNGCVSNEV
jgi:sugar-specific transcriptional regulator TrmB